MTDNFTPGNWLAASTLDDTGDLLIVAKCPQIDGNIVLARAFTDLRRDGEASPEVLGNAMMLSAAPLLLQTVRTAAETMEHMQHTMRLAGIDKQEHQRILNLMRTAIVIATNPTARN